LHAEVGIRAFHVTAVQTCALPFFLLGVALTHDVLPWSEYRLELAYYNNKEKFSSPGVAPGIRDPFGIPPNSSDSDFKRYDANFRSEERRGGRGRTELWPRADSRM